MFAFGLQDLHLHTRNIICRHYPLAPTYAKAVAGRKGCVCVCVSLHWYAHMPDSYAIAQPFARTPSVLLVRPRNVQLAAAWPPSVAVLLSSNVEKEIPLTVEWTRRHTHATHATNATHNKCGCYIIVIDVVVAITFSTHIHTYGRQ